MKRHIRLADLAHIPTPRHDTYPSAMMDAARAVMVARGLRFDNGTGKVRDNRDGVISRYSNPADFKPHTCEADVMQWEFRSYMANSASRVSRGYSP